MSDTWGRKCKPGWGWNQYLDLLVPVQRKPPNVTSRVTNFWFYGVWDMSSTDIKCWVSFSFAH